MGQCISSNDAASLRDLVRRPDEPEDVLLTASKINDGLTLVAQTLDKQGLSISIVAIGGAVNTLFLHSRLTTSDIDFFYRTKLKNKDVASVIEAARVSAKEIEVGECWLNNHTALFMEEGMVGHLYNEAINQEDMIFDQPGLKVFAAPWHYALVTKMDRLSKPSTREYDLDDAIVYLERLNRKRGHLAARDELKEWAQTFKFTVPTDELLNKHTELRRGREVLYEDDLCLL